MQRLKSNPLAFCALFFDEPIPNFTKEVLEILNKRVRFHKKPVKAYRPKRLTTHPSMMMTLPAAERPEITGTHKERVVVIIDECDVGGIIDEIRELIEKSSL